MAEEAQAEKKEGEGEAAPKSKKKLFMIIGGVVLLLVIGVVVMMMMGKSKEEPKKEEKAAEGPKHFATAQLPTIIVNLSESTSFLKVGLLLEYDPEILAKAGGETGGGTGGGHGGEGGESKGGLPGVMAKREPMIKDAIIRVLSSRKADELLVSEGKEKLKEELIEAINEASGLEEGPIVAIYFTEFIIQ